MAMRAENVLIICAKQGSDFEAKVAKLVELGFGREAVVQALKFFDGNEEQAAAYLFGGWRCLISNLCLSTFYHVTYFYHY